MMRPNRRAVIGGAAACVALPALAGGVVHSIAIKRFKFDPSHVVVQVGDTIEWTNDDLAPHTASADEFGWDTGEIAKGSSVKIIITTGMETSYFCAFHPHMKGTIEIQSK
jgi:plastocyanin